MKRRFLVFAVLAKLASPAFAQQMYALDDSPWERVDEVTWTLERDAPGGQWDIVLKVAEGTAYFTAYVPCENGYTAVHTWKYGDTLSRGLTCNGKKVRTATNHWKQWTRPLPQEVQILYRKRSM